MVLAGALAIASIVWLTVVVGPMKVGSIGEYIRQQREQAKISMRQLASAAGVSNPYLSQIERGLRRPSAEILQQIAKGLRISAEALYVQAGILEDRQSESGVRTAVLADPGLSERQKQVLLEIYESFRKEMAASEEDAETAEGSELGDLATDGAAADGQALGGSTPDGSTPDGSTPDGAALGGTALGGAALNGAAHANAWADAVEPDAAGPDPAE
jgi:transcriptional regulator with XRE-family HTH domain